MKNTKLPKSHFKSKKIIPYMTNSKNTHKGDLGRRGGVSFLPIFGANFGGFWPHDFGGLFDVLSS